MKGKQKESAGWSSGSYSVKSTVEELAEVVWKAEGRKRGRSGSRKGSPLTNTSHVDHNLDDHHVQVGAPHCAERFDSMNGHTVSNNSG